MRKLCRGIPITPRIIEDASFSPFHAGCWAKAVFTKAMGKIGRSGGAALLCLSLEARSSTLCFDGAAGLKWRGFEHQNPFEGTKHALKCID